MKEMNNSVDERIRLYERTRSELIIGQRENATLFDRSVLTLSSGFLAISIAFISNYATAGLIQYKWLLITSWALFALTIIITLSGILYGQYVLQKLIYGAREYYLENNPEAYSESTNLSNKIDKLNNFVGVMFASAVTATVVFASLNVVEQTTNISISKEANKLDSNKK